MGVAHGCGPGLKAPIKHSVSCQDGCALFFSLTFSPACTYGDERWLFKCYVLSRDGVKAGCWRIGELLVSMPGSGTEAVKNVSNERRYHFEEN